MRRPRVPTRRRARCPPSSFPAPGSVRSGFPGFPCDTSAWISNVHGRCPVRAAESEPVPYERKGRDARGCHRRLRRALGRTGRLSSASPTARSITCCRACALLRFARRAVVRRGAPADASGRRSAERPAAAAGAPVQVLPSMQERGTGSGARGDVWAIVGALRADRLEGGYYRRHYLDVGHAGPIVRPLGDQRLRGPRPSHVRRPQPLCVDVPVARSGHFRAQAGDSPSGMSGSPAIPARRRQGDRRVRGRSAP